MAPKLKPLKLTDKTLAPDYLTTLEIELTDNNAEARGKVWVIAVTESKAEGSDRVGIYLTPAQARRFAARLVQFADAVGAK